MIKLGVTLARKDYPPQMDLNLLYKLPNSYIGIVVRILPNQNKSNTYNYSPFLKSCILKIRQLVLLKIISDLYEQVQQVILRQVS